MDAQDRIYWHWPNSAPKKNKLRPDRVGAALASRWHGEEQAMSHSPPFRRIHWMRAEESEVWIDLI